MPVFPVYNCLAVNNLAFWRFHGMEEVIGSIPIRSTKMNPAVSLQWVVAPHPHPNMSETQKRPSRLALTRPETFLRLRDWKLD